MAAYYRGRTEAFSTKIGLSIGAVMGFGDYARPPGIVAGKFTAGKEALVLLSIARKENYGTICSKYYHKKNYQIRTDKPLKTCTVLKTSGKASWIFS